MLVGVVGESGMFHKKPSPPCSVRMRASAVGVAAQTPTSQQESSHLTQSSSHTHILRSVTPHRLGRGVQLLYPVVDQPAVDSLDISPRCVVVEERQTDRVSHCSCFSSDTSEGKGEREGARTKRKGGERDSQGRDNRVERYTSRFL